MCSACPLNVIIFQSAIVEAVWMVAGDVCLQACHEWVIGDREGLCRGATVCTAGKR